MLNSRCLMPRLRGVFRRIKSYMRNRLNQEHLNHFMLLNVHKKLTDSIDLNLVAKTFVQRNERRINFFGKF